MIRFLLILSSCVLVEAATAYYVNPATGLDANNGLSAGAAWQTAAKITTETGVSGTMANGDTLIIDTSSSPLLIGASTMTIAKQITVQAASGQTFWTAQAHTNISSGQWSKTVGYTNTYQVTLDGTQTSIVLWEDDKWPNHPLGATFASVANSLDSTPGSVWTDGMTLYYHPFGDTDPRSDSKIYTRSINRGAGDFAITLAAQNIHFTQCYSGKTCLADKSTGDGILGYVVGTAGGFGGTSVISDCYFYYGSKHALGLVASDSNSDVEVRDVIAEQCTPYASCSSLVSYMASGSNNIHRYIRCTTIHGIGLIGSTTGTNDTQSVLLSHNSGGSFPFNSIYIQDCNFPLGYVNLSVTTNAIFSGGTIGEIVANSPVTTVDRVKINRAWIDQSYSISPIITVRNSIFVPTTLIGLGGCQTQGTMDVQACTFDLSGITTADTQLGVFKRAAATTLISQNNIFLIPTNRAFTVYQSFVNTDTLTITHNDYRLGYNTQVAFNYNDGTTTAARTFAQWQALGFDANSLNTDPLVNGAYRPFPTSPAIGAGVDLGPMVDYSGALFQVRNTIGAYEYVWLPASSISGRVTTGGNVIMR